MAKRWRNHKVSGYETRYDSISRGIDYQPFIKIQDVPSKGRSTRIQGIKTQRQHDFLSDLERNYFFILEFCDDVIDIREQFPLELSKTLLIAEELGIKHPVHPTTKEAIIMTSDFSITRMCEGRAEDIVRTTKYKKDLLDRRNIEKFMIEEKYWKDLGVDWGIVTEAEINKTYSQNISDVLHYHDLTVNSAFCNMSLDELEDIIVAYTQNLIGNSASIRSISSRFDKDIGLSKGSGIALFKHLIAKKYISVDLTKPLSLDQCIEIKLNKMSQLVGADAS